MIMVFEIGNTMFSSKKDLEGVMGLFVVIIVSTVLPIVGAWLLGVTVPYHRINEFFTVPVVNFLVMMAFYLLIPIGLNMLILIFSRLMVRR